MTILKIVLLIQFLFIIFVGIVKAEEIGIASWYSVESSSNMTASGERFKNDGFTCAKWDVPFNMVLKITNIANSKFVLARVNDRGPNKRLHRAIDLSKGAFAKIADLKLGVITVKIEVVHP
jgi:rare lipoprotein A